MHAAVMSQIHNADVFISVAAVADWHVKNPSAQKIKKSVQAFPMALEFMPNPDILEEVAALPDGPWCVGFAAETENLDEYARSEEHTSELQSLMRNSYAVFCLKKKINNINTTLTSRNK